MTKNSPYALSMLRRLLAATAAIVVACAAGCGKPQEDEATKQYKGPGPSKAGAPSSTGPGGGPTTR
jgi:hypothetical protein